MTEDPQPPAPASPQPPTEPGLLRRWLRALNPNGAVQGRVNLALQGGGAHGAYTWGVLDALLEDERLNFEGLSGSSAGAMNAVVLADGWMKGGREGARQALAAFWTELGRQMPWDLVTRAQGDSVALTTLSKMMGKLTGYFSPSQFNPLDLNPLRDLLAVQVDFKGLRAHSPFKLFVGTTQVNTGRLRVFRETELWVDVLLASACLPKIHRTIMIGGEPYWDGGFSANPAVTPLLLECEARDVLLVLLNPLKHARMPRGVAEIDARIAELGFSANFAREMQLLSQARAFAAAHGGDEGGLSRRLLEMRFHMIDASNMESLHRSDTKLLAHGPFLRRLHQQGRERTAAWLKQSATDLGRRSSIDVKALFD